MLEIYISLTAYAKILCNNSQILNHSKSDYHNVVVFILLRILGIKVTFCQMFKWNEKGSRFRWVLIISVNWIVFLSITLPSGVTRRFGIIAGDYRGQPLCFTDSHVRGEFGQLEVRAAGVGTSRVKEAMSGKKKRDPGKETLQLRLILFSDQIKTFPDYG
jgi:hypothetical protein